MASGSTHPDTINGVTVTQFGSTRTWYAALGSLSTGSVTISLDSGTTFVALTDLVLAFLYT